MKKYLIYLTILLIVIIFSYQLKIIFSNDSPINNNKNIHIEKPYAEVEVLNGCGDEGIARLYTNFLRYNCA